MKDKFDYFLKNFSLFYDLEQIKIGYGKEMNEQVNIVQSIDNSFFADKIDIDPTNVVWKTWKGVKIPFLFESDNNKEIICIDNKKIIINYDIVAGSFYFLSGWNEYINQVKDNLGRTSFENCVLNKLDIIKKPVVNYYFDILEHALSKVYGSVRKDIWGPYNFGVALTHDIDICNSGWIEDSFFELKRFRIFSSLKILSKRLFFKDEWFNFQNISKIERQFSASSTFFFLSQKGKEGKLKNADYNIKNLSIQTELSILKNSGQEIGVHGSFGTHLNADKLNREIKKIEQFITKGNRFHFLMFDAEKTVDVLENCSIKYDSTLCYSEHIGFRRSTCFPFYLYNFLSNRCSSIIEIPLLVMDSTFHNQNYMGISPNDSILEIIKLADEVKKFKGVFTVLWHNNFFSDYKYSGWSNVYIRMLEYFKFNNAFLTNCQNIYDKIIGE